MAGVLSDTGLTVCYNRGPLYFPQRAGDSTPQSLSRGLDLQHHSLASCMHARSNTKRLCCVQRCLRCIRKGEHLETVGKLYNAHWLEIYSVNPALHSNPAVMKNMVKGGKKL